MSVWEIVSLVATGLGIVGAALVAVTLCVCGRAVASVAADELKGWLPYMAAALVTTAAARLPAPDQDRYREEWLAELLDYQGRGVAALMYSVRVRSRVRALTNELPAPNAAKTEHDGARTPTAATARPLGSPDRVADKEFGRALRQARDAAGMSTRDLAVRLHYVPSTLNGYMRGDYRPERWTVEAWEELCNAPPRSLTQLWERLPPKRVTRGVNPASSQ
jgi:hypothetical protein